MDATRRATLRTMAAATAGGLVGHGAGVPAGPLIGAMVAVAALNTRGGRARLPVWVPEAARVLIGSTAGALVTRELLGELGPQLAWGLGGAVVIMLAGLGCGLLMSRWAGIDRGTAIVACSPGGMSELSILAHDLGLRTEVVVGVHLLRRVITLVAVLGVIAVAPPP